MIKGLEPRLLPQTKGYTVGEINLGDVRAAPGWTSLMSTGPFPPNTLSTASEGARAMERLCHKRHRC